jgi:hypothetical protein
VQLVLLRRHLQARRAVALQQRARTEALALTETSAGDDGYDRMTTRSRMTSILVLALCCGCDTDKIGHDDSSTGEAGDEETFPTRMAEAYCAQLFACDPTHTCFETGAPYASEADCVTAERTALEEASTAAREAGLVFDATCVEDTIARYAAIGCDGDQRLQIRGIELFSVCPPYYGTIPLDEGPCLEVVGSGLSECAQGLVCYDEPGSCVPGALEPCVCDPGSACFEWDGESPPACLPLVGAGAECFDGAMYIAACGVEGACEIQFDEASHMTSSACQARAPLGATCVSANDCSSYYCDETCKPAAPFLCQERAAPRNWR